MSRSLHELIAETANAGWLSRRVHACTRERQRGIQSEVDKTKQAGTYEINSGEKQLPTVAV